MEDTVQDVVTPTEPQEVGKPTEITVADVTTVIKNDPTILKNLLNEDFAKPILQPVLDSHFSKGLKTWQDNNLDKIVNQKVAELNPSETPEQQALREVKQELEQMKQQASLKELELAKRDVLTEVGLGQEFGQYVTGTTTDELKQSATDFHALLTQTIDVNVEKKVDERFKKASFEPKGDANPKTDVKTKSFSEMSFFELAQLQSSNPALYAKMKAESARKKLKK